MHVYACSMHTRENKTECICKQIKTGNRDLMTSAGYFKPQNKNNIAVNFVVISAWYNCVFTMHQSLFTIT